MLRNKCTIGMCNSLRTDKQQIAIIADNSEYDCRLLAPMLEHVQPIVKSTPFVFQTKATYVNPIHKRIIIIIP